MSGSREKIEVVGFSSINFGYTEANKPYIEFVAMDTEGNRARYLNQESDYFNLCSISTEAGIIKIRVDGKAKVAYMIQKFKGESIYKNFSIEQCVKLENFNIA